MSPEQVAADPAALDQRSDVYTLGIILYELLAGRLPYLVEYLPLPEAARVIREQEPSRLGALATHLRGDVETIVARALEKERARRYSSSAELAADVRRHLRNEPIRARPPSALYQLGKFARRNKALVGGVAAVMLALLAGLIGTTLFAVREGRQRGEADHNAALASEARREAETTLVDMYTTSGIQAGDQGENARAALWFANAARRARADPDRQHANVIRARTWGRRALAPLHALVADGSWPGGLVFHPGGRHLLATTVLDGKTRDSSYTLWDLDAEQSLSFPGGAKAVPAAAWSANGRALAMGRPGGDVIVAGFPGGAEAAHIQFPGRIRLLTYSADGRYLAIAGGNSARVWDVRAGAFATPELAHPEAVTTLAFHPEGRYLATGCRDNRARLFAVPGDAAKPLWSPVPHVQDTTGDPRRPPVFFSPPQFIDRGRGLLTVGGEGGLTWRAVETGAEVRTLDSPELFVRGVAAAKLSPDGRYLAVFGVQHSGIRLFAVATGRPVGPVLVHKNSVYDADFSPDSRMLLTSSSDGTARLWAVPDGEPVARPLDLHRTVHRVAFAPNGRSLATQDGELVRLWVLPQEGLPMFDVPLDPCFSFAALSPDAAQVIPTGVTCGGSRALRTTRAHRVATGEPAGPPLRPRGLIFDAAFSPDGRTVATVDEAKEGQEVRVWDPTSGQMRWRAPLPSDPRSVTYHPDGGRLAVLCGGGEVIVFDSGAGREVRRWQAHDAEKASHWVNNGKVGFSPDGRALLTWGMGNDLRVWEAETGEPRYPPLRHRDKCHDVQFSPDGRSMALASYDGSVRVRNLATGTVLAELPGHPDLVYSASFSPDGRLLVTACRDHAVRVWDWRAGRLACPPFEHDRDAMAATFTPDGRWVLSVSAGEPWVRGWRDRDLRRGGTARAWDWRTGKAVTPALGLGGNPVSLIVTPDGKHAVVGGFRTELAVLDLGELGRDDDDLDALCMWAELLAVQRLHEGGGTVNLSAAEWLQRWREFRRLGEGRKSN
jgi:WD40 repeat protein